LNDGEVARTKRGLISVILFRFELNQQPRLLSFNRTVENIFSSNGYAEQFLVVRMKNKHKNKKISDSQWTALVGLTGLHFIKMHGPTPSLEKQISRGEMMLIVVKPLKSNLAWVCDEINMISEKSKTLALAALDQAIENKLLEIVGLNTGDQDVNHEVSCIVADWFGLDVVY
jgi:hypothetical protein